MPLTTQLDESAVNDDLLAHARAAGTIESVASTVTAPRVH